MKVFGTNNLRKYYVYVGVEAVRKILREKDPEIRPFDDLSKSTKRRYVLQLARQVRFEINEKKYDVNYGKFDKDNDTKLKHAVVKSLDRGRISRDAYRSLTDINQHLSREKSISIIRKRINELVQKNIPISLVNIYQPTTFEPISGQPHITEPEIIQNVMDYIGKGGQRRITDILNYIVPKYIEQGILIPNQSKIKLRISGDGRNVERKVKHVMITVALLNDIERLYKPESHYTLVLYPSSESYESLHNSLVPLVSDLQNLKENGFHQIVQKNIPISLVNIYQPTTFEPISGQPHITEPEIIQNVMDYIGKGGQRRITDILNYIVPKYIEQGILIPNQSKIKLRISGDGRNVERKVKHVMITVALLNDIERLYKPESHYTLVLYPSSESYESLHNSLVPLVSDLQNLKENGFHQIATCLGINAANSNYFCPWCLCSKNDQEKLDSNGKLIGNWTITKNISNIKQNFLQIQEHIHRLFELFLSDLKRNGELGQIIQQQILMEMKRLKINFQFWSEKNSNKLSYTFMMGPDKLKVLCEFNFASIDTNYLSKEKQQQLRKLWNGFDELYNLLHKKNITESYFWQKAIQWLEYFLTSSKGRPHQNFIRSLYRSTDCTPYMHVLVYHVLEFLSLHQDLGLISFSCAAVEKKNNIQVCQYFQNTLKDSGHENSKKSSILEILEHKNRQLFYWIENVPNHFKKTTQYRLEI
ncbi:hypothetical protein Glove_490g31 [Diversispora epigaea]|uniref:Uncharacterized protein n=1 Tax=Diversispora epigaea TaxID=1348612 RepID=A0A397GPB1_9GLOM|nr:hypothetical protein Glove_490g31 [Diversispora epigaea]